MKNGFSYKSSRAAMAAMLVLGGLGVHEPAHATCSPEPYIASICITAAFFCPRGYAEAAGQLLPISSNTALFSLVGTTYGGDGRTTFGLPDLRGRSAVGDGSGPGLSNIRLGQRGGAENRTLSIAQLPSHNHSASTSVTVSVTATLNADSTSGDTTNPAGNVLAVKNRSNNYSTRTPNAAMSSDAISTFATATGSTSVNNTGGSQALGIRSPYIALKHCIALTGLYPSRD